MITIERFKEYLESKGISNAQAERDCGFSNGLIGNAFKTKTAIGSDKLEKILIVYSDLSAEWLLRGTGTMLTIESMHDDEHDSKFKQFQNKVVSMSSNKEQMNMAYDIAMSALDLVGKTYDFFSKKGI